MINQKQNQKINYVWRDSIKPAPVIFEHYFYLLFFY